MMMLKVAQYHSRTDGGNAEYMTVRCLAVALRYARALPFVLDAIAFARNARLMCFAVTTARCTMGTSVAMCVVRATASM